MTETEQQMRWLRSRLRHNFQMLTSVYVHICEHCCVVHVLTLNWLTSEK